MGKFPDVGIGDELGRRLSRYVAGRESLAQLESWLLPSLGAIDDSGDGEIERVAMTAAAYLSEFSDGLFSESELKQRLQSLGLQPLAEAYRVGARDPRWETGASAFNVVLRSASATA